MKIPVIIMVICLSIFGYVKYQDMSKERVVVEEVQRRTNSNGFTDLTYNLVNNNGIVILAPINCSADRAKRADDLARRLQEQGISVVRSNSLSFSQRMEPGDELLFAAINMLIKQPAPLVFVNGKIQSDPRLQAVLDEYNKDKGKS